MMLSSIVTFGAGGVLLQADVNAVVKPVSYFSKSLTNFDMYDGSGTTPCCVYRSQSADVSAITSKPKSMVDEMGCIFQPYRI